MNSERFLPFHRGELEAQRRAGVSARVAAIRDFMPEQHRDFYALLRYLFVATVDAEGQPFATILTGEPGFIDSPDERTLRIAAAPDASDLAAGTFAPGGRIGLLGIDLATRRRNRANGAITALTATGLSVAIRESFGNCPQYIQGRDVRAATTTAAPVEPFAHLDGEHAALIRRADTFFVATSAGDAGVDMSHRGGRPGFVRVDGDELTIPDFRGNRYFNTLGNLVIEPRAALLFVDFETGDLLHLQGAATINWNPDEAAVIDGAERLWRLRVARGWLRRRALPLRWAFRDYAPTTERTGAWPTDAAA